MLLRRERLEKSMSNIFRNAFFWAGSLGKNTSAIINIDGNRSNLLLQVRVACQRDGFTVEMVRQPAIVPAVAVAVELGDKATSVMLERGGDDWQDIVLEAADHLRACDEATVFVQLDAREARIYICCMQAADGIKRARKVTLVDVVDSHSLADAYLEATKPAKPLDDDE
jgi:hypothetical protein